MQCKCTILSSVACLVVKYFPLYLINGTIFGGGGKAAEHTMGVLIFFTHFVWNITYSKQWAIYDQKYTLVFMETTLYSCPILMARDLSRQIFEKSSETKFHENSSSGSRVVPCGRMDRRTDMMKLIVAFRNFSNMPKKLIVSQNMTV
jgi:hypothetical protein